MEKKKKDKYYTGNENMNISRKEALKKAGYAAFSAATMMFLLNDPVKAQSNSPAPMPPWDDDDWG